MTDTKQPQKLYFEYDSQFIYTLHTSTAKNIIIPISENTGQCLSRPLVKFPLLNHFGICLGNGFLYGKQETFIFSIYTTLLKNFNTNYRIQTMSEFSQTTIKKLGSFIYDSKKVYSTLDTIQQMIRKNKRYFIFDNNCTSMLHTCFPSHYNVIYNNVDYIYMICIFLLMLWALFYFWRKRR